MGVVVFRIETDGSFTKGGQANTESENNDFIAV